MPALLSKAAPLPANRSAPEGGEVSPHAEVRGWDSGPGIALEDLPHVFERFYRADRVRSKTPGPGGSGLGLRQSVEAHGRQIWLESEVEKGTTGIVRLPLA